MLRISAYMCIHLTLSSGPLAFSYRGIMWGDSIASLLLSGFRRGAGLQRTLIHSDRPPGEGSTGTLCLQKRSPGRGPQSNGEMRTKTKKPLLIFSGVILSDLNCCFWNIFCLCHDLWMRSTHVLEGNDDILSNTQVKEVIHLLLWEYNNYNVKSVLQCWGSVKEWKTALWSSEQVCKFWFLTAGCGPVAAAWNWTRWGSPGRPRSGAAFLPPVAPDMQNLHRPLEQTTNTQQFWQKKQIYITSGQKHLMCEVMLEDKYRSVGCPHTKVNTDVCYLHVQGHQRFADTMKIDAKAHGKLLCQFSNLTEILPAGILQEHLGVELNTNNMTSHLHAIHHHLFKSFHQHWYADSCALQNNDIKLLCLHSCKQGGVITERKRSVASFYEKGQRRCSKKSATWNTKWFNNYKKLTSVSVISI